MIDLATKVALSDDPRVSRAIHPKSGYIPPNKSESIMLSEALRGTGRLPDTARKWPEIDMVTSRYVAL
jgi:hypothetical protein